MPLHVFPSLTPLGTVERVEGRFHHAAISGENYHALQLLAFLLPGRFDCIYIDPPYNTGDRDWKYNNDFTGRDDGWPHSRWLSFMERRLVLARGLLHPEGVLAVAIDENEHAHLAMLLEALFPDRSITSVAVVHNPRGVQGENFSHTNEFVLFAIPSGLKAIAPRPLEPHARRPSNLRNWGGESRRGDARNCFYPIFVEHSAVAGFGDVAPDDFHPKQAVEPLGEGRFAVWPIDRKGVERKWRYARDSVEKIRGQLAAEEARGRIQVLLTKPAEQYRTVWQDPLYDAGVYGTRLLRRFIDADFPFPKSLYAVYQVLHACTALKPDALILDFFAGSGTTLHATCLLNSLDRGSRRCVLVTNNEVEEKLARALAHRGRYPGDPEFEKEGIFEKVTVPRCRAALTGLRHDSTPIPGRYRVGDGRAMAAGFEENVAFYRLDYLNPEKVCHGSGTERRRAGACPLPPARPSLEALQQLRDGASGTFGRPVLDFDGGDLCRAYLDHFAAR